MEIFDYIASVLIGISLGLIGEWWKRSYRASTGLSFRIRHFFFPFYLEPAVLSARFNISKGLVTFKTAVIFGVPSIISIFPTRNFVLALIPDNVFVIGNFTVRQNIFLLLIFAGVNDYCFLQNNSKKNRGAVANC